MRVSTSVKLKGILGLQNFMSLLIKELELNYDVKFVSEKEKSDIHLSVIKGYKKGSKNILRIDGVYYDNKRLNMNKPIKYAIKRSDGVIYQSKWSKNFVERMLNVKNERSDVIHNGSSIIDTDPADRKGYDKIIVSCAHWRPNKRPEAIVDAFLKVKRITNIKVGLFMVGPIKSETIKDNDIYYFGKQSKEKVHSIYKASDIMCHICHIDSCPNSVVEGLLYGLPVVCNNISGTPEIVKDSGIIVQLDKPFDFKPIVNMNSVGSKNIDTDKLAQALFDACNKKWDIKREDLTINYTAKQYYNFFLKVLNV